MAASFFLWLFMLPYSTLYSIMTMGATLIFWREEGVDVRKMMGHKRSPCSVDQSSYTSIESKRQKANDLSITAKERKEKLSERIVALQQLVSPYGKLLSAPYLESSAATKDPGLEPCSLRSRGLCLVPVSLTIGVAESNGADIWAPIKTTTSPPKFEKEAAQFQS
ncbi:transcription factor bHLH153 isoform X6 [Arachis ipaensis]|uniref:transcription factor bHLH153 isoform X6 n=1 Tax=Arachis ipaensis TaxID=130454 RepID=UPI000A2B2816|nr:transcription factor bHLH153 isoform X6 [Arachis ipaensis]XP_025681826.1 transcription factor bHLH153 isoform X4 [Arachis hypogaea]